MQPGKARSVPYLFYGSWGFIVAFLRNFLEIEALEVLDHRILCSLLFLLLLLAFQKRLLELLAFRKKTTATGPDVADLAVVRSELADPHLSNQHWFNH